MRGVREASAGGVGGERGVKQSADAPGTGTSYAPPSVHPHQLAGSQQRPLRVIVFEEVGGVSKETIDVACGFSGKTWWCG